MYKDIKKAQVQANCRVDIVSFPTINYPACVVKDKARHHHDDTRGNG